MAFVQAVNPNPVVAIDIRMVDGAVLRFEMPSVPQGQVLWELGKMLRKLGVPLELCLPEEEGERRWWWPMKPKPKGSKPLDLFEIRQKLALLKLGKWPWSRERKGRR